MIFTIDTHFIWSNVISYTIIINVLVSCKSVEVRIINDSRLCVRTYDTNYRLVTAKDFDEGLTLAAEATRWHTHSLGNNSL